MKVWVLQHVACEDLGTISDALESKRISAHYVRSFAGQPVPASMDDAAGLIVMGGPMGVYDQPRVSVSAEGNEADRRGSEEGEAAFGGLSRQSTSGGGLGGRSEERQGQGNRVASHQSDCRPRRAMRFGRASNPLSWPTTGMATSSTSRQAPRRSLPPR